MRLPATAMVTTARKSYSNPRHDVRAEAISIRRLLLHDYKNPYCDICQESVSSPKQNRRRHNVELYRTFGDLITMDHVNTNSLIHNGLADEKELLVVTDLATGYMGAFPVGSKRGVRVD